MRKRSRQAADPEWKQLLRLGEQLVGQPTPSDQCTRISEVVGSLLSAHARVWLASPIYPLPGTPAVETLPEAPDAPDLARAVYAARKILCQGPTGQTDPAGASCTSQDGADGPTTAAVPMMANGSLHGVVLVERPEDRPFTERDFSLLEGLVAHAAAALETTRQEALKNWRHEQLSLVRSVSSQIAGSSHLKELYSRVTRLIQETFSFYYVAIFTIDSSQSVLRFRASASKDQRVPLRSDFWVHLGDGIVGTVAESGAEIVAPDVRQDDRYLYLDLLPETVSEAALPLKIGSRILGVLDVQSDRPHVFHETDMLALRSLADNIAIAIENTHLYEKLERRAEQISTIFEVSHALTSILDLDELLNEVVRLIRNRFEYPYVHVYTVHRGRSMIIYRAGTGKRSEYLSQRVRDIPVDSPRGLIPWVARTGKPLLVNDVSLEPLYQPSDVPPDNTRSELCIPLVAAEEVLGVLDIQSEDLNAFDQNDQSLFEALAAPIAAAMRNANLYRSEQWRRNVAESFRDVAYLISANLPLDELLDNILEKLENVLPCEASAIWLLNEEAAPNGEKGKPHLRLAATRNLEVEKIFEALQDKPVLQMLERAIESDLPLIRDPKDPLGPLGAALRFEKDYSSIAAPMRTGQRVLGMLTMAHSQKGRYGSESQAITATFASYAAVAIQNARLYGESQEQALISTMLLQVAEASQSTMTVDDLLSTMVRLTRLLIGVKKCAFLLLDEGQKVYELKAWYGFEPDIENTTRNVFSSSAMKRLADERSILYLDDPGLELDMPEMRLSPGTVIMLPLLVRGQLIGAFLVGLQLASQTSIEPGFDPKALSILQGIAHQTSITVDNLQLLEARQEEAYVTAALLQVAQAVVSSNNLNDTLDTIVHLLPILVGIETCVIYLWDAANRVFRATQVSTVSRRMEEVIQSRAFRPDENRLLDAIRTEGGTYMCPIPRPDMPFEEWGLLECQPYEQGSEISLPNHEDWVLGYPLTLQNQVMGVLIVREMNATPSFWERRLEIIHGIAQQVSLAIQNDILKQEMVQTERIEREMQLARQIQETFLPDTLPTVKNWELDVRWETARQIGGDFYDVFLLDDNHIGLVIADVADKGLPAALYMTVTRTLIRSNASDTLSPARVLEETNQQLINDSAESMFATVVYAVLAIDTGILAYANAGHNLPLLYRAKTGRVEQLAKGGTALGVIDNLEIKDHQIKIEKGDALFLYTDGVTDLQSPIGEYFGEQRMRDTIQAHGGDTIQNQLEQLDDAMIEFRRGTPPADDVTILALRREPARKRKRREKDNQTQV